MEIAQLDELCSLIAEHRDVAEDTAKLDPAVVEAAGKAGLWVAGAPKEVGGLELGLADLLALCERIGEADASVAWHIVNSGGAGHAAAFVPDSIRRQVFASTLHPFGFSGAVAAGIKVARDTGGFRLAGTWPFMTGVLDADWACVTVVMPAEQGEDGQPPDVRRVFMPLGACEVHRTWDNATSMRGTGSHAVTADGVVVPVEATITYRAEPFIDRPAYRIPSHLPFVGGASAISIGILRSTIVGVIELCATKVSRLDGRKHFEDPRVQQYIADATAVADSLTANLEARAKVLDARYTGWTATGKTRPSPLVVCGVLHSRCSSQRGQQAVSHRDEQRLRDPQPGRTRPPGFTCHHCGLRELPDHSPSSRRGPTRSRSEPSTPLGRSP